MPRCQWTEMCPFFNDEVGYSIALQVEMRNQYCLGDNSECERLRSMDVLPLSRVPIDLIPTETDRLNTLIREYHAEICRMCCETDPCP